MNTYRVETDQQKPDRENPDRGRPNEDRPDRLRPNEDRPDRGRPDEADTPDSDTDPGAADSEGTTDQ
jgi:hypothetical protein